MKVGKKKEKDKRIPLYSWLPIGTYHKKSSDLEFFFFKNLMNLGHFFLMIHHLYRWKSYFSGWNLAKLLQKKHTLVLASHVNTSSSSSSSSSHILLISYCNTWFPSESWYKICRTLFQFILKNKNRRRSRNKEVKIWKTEARWGEARRFKKWNAHWSRRFVFWNISAFAFA
jgi:hypothetical protein